MLKILHLLPGRARLRVEMLKGHPELGQQIRTQLEAVRHIDRVMVDARTGSLLLLYDSRALGSPTFLDEVSRALGKIYPGRIAPGHLQVRVRRLKGKPELARALETRLSRVRGIRRISIDPVSGSCQLDYESKAVTSPDFLDAVSDALGTVLPRLNLRKQLLLAGIRRR